MIGLICAPHSACLRRLYSALLRHIKERQNGIYCLNFLKQLHNSKDETLFLIKSNNTMTFHLCSG